jgi:hypothetical protein
VLVGAGKNTGGKDRRRYQYAFVRLAQRLISPPPLVTILPQ